MQNPPSIRVGGQASKSSYQYTLQDTNQEELDASALKLMNLLSHARGFADVTTDMDLNSPAVNVDIDRDQAAAQGVSVQSIETALGASFGGRADFHHLCQRRGILGDAGAAAPATRAIPHRSICCMCRPATATGGIAGGGSTGIAGACQHRHRRRRVPTIVPLNAVTRLRMGTMPLSINHLGQLPSVTISFNLLPGFALSDAVTAIDQARSQADIPAAVQGQFQGTAQAFQSSMANIGILLAIAILTVYIILGILYESFIHPLTILSGLPSAAVGALITLELFGVPLSLYAFVGMIMLIGIVKKNAIMMIDFALHRQRGERRQARRGDLRSGAGAFPPHHDDDHGGADGHPADRHRLRRRFGSAPAAGPGGGGRACSCPSC